MDFNQPKYKFGLLETPITGKDDPNPFDMKTPVGGLAHPFQGHRSRSKGPIASSSGISTNTSKKYGLIETPDGHDLFLDAQTPAGQIPRPFQGQRSRQKGPTASTSGISTGISNYSTLSGSSTYSDSSDTYDRDSSSIKSSEGNFRTPSTSRTYRTASTSTNHRSKVTGSSSTPGSRKFSGSNSDRLKTTGSYTTPYSCTSEESSYSVIVAVVEGRGMARGEIGLASIDLKNPTLILSQFSDTQIYVKTITKLLLLKPVEIIMPNTACENGNMTKLMKLVTDEFQGISVSTVQRKYFNETSGIEYVKQLCVPEFNSVEMEVSTKYYCLAAAAALMKYVQFMQNAIYAPGSLRIIFTGSENTTLIDAASAKKLELLQNLRDPRSDHTLYGIINYTKTSGGARLLRANILQPPCDIETITMRQDVVAELTEKEDVFYNMQAILGRFLDIDHLLSQCIQIPKQETMKTAENKLTNIIYLKHTIEMIEAFRNALGDCENSLFKAYYKSLEDPRFTLIQSKICSVIDEQAKYQKGGLNMRTQRCFAVKPKINGLLDVARRTYSEIVEDIADMTKQLCEQHELPIQTTYSMSRGFHLQIHCGPKDTYTVESLPSVFIKASKVKNTISFTTSDLMKLNDRVNESFQEISLMSNIVVTELLSDIRDNIGCLYKLSETVAVVDMLQSFAHACTLSNYVRPEFTDTLAIKQGRHPILEKISVEAPVPNDVYASEDSNFIIITGPNMSGKSTYIRQIVLLQVLAQIGCFVPAVYASFRITDHIFTRIGSDDDMHTNSSTFMLEMREINYITQNASSRSLIIIDELGRGTSAEEGVGICHAICEHLLKQKSFTFFTTHFLELTNLESLYPNVENFCFEVYHTYSSDGDQKKIVYTHILTKGKTQEKHYGLQLAELSTMPSSVVENAKKIANQIIQEKQQREEMQVELKQQRADFKLATRLIQAARNSRLDEDGLRIYLSSLRQQYYQEIGKISNPSNLSLPDE